MSAGLRARSAGPSARSWAARAWRSSRRRAGRRDERQARAAQMRAEGSALRERKLADLAFQAAPLAYQVAFWEDFSQRYPEVSCAEPLMIARLRLNEKQKERRWREALADRPDE